MTIQEYIQKESKKRYKKTLARDTFSNMANKMVMHNRKIYSDGLSAGIELAKSFAEWCIPNMTTTDDGYYECYKDGKHFKFCKTMSELFEIFLNERNEKV